MVTKLIKVVELMNNKKKPMSTQEIADALNFKYQSAYRAIRRLKKYDIIKPAKVKSMWRVKGEAVTYFEIVKTRVVGRFIDRVLRETREAEYEERRQKFQAF